MTEFTKANPFEFEGLHVYRDGLFGDISHHDTAATRFMDVKSNERIARAMHSFLEAENNEWHEDGEWFRKGRWFVEVGEPSYVYVSHEDLPGEAWACYDLDDWDRGTPNAVRAVGASFHAWHAANYPKQPAEPTGLGAVVEVTCDTGTDRHVHCGGGYWTRWSGVLVVRWESLIEDAESPVTVLSEGVSA